MSKWHAFKRGAMANTYESFDEDEDVRTLADRVHTQHPELYTTREDGLTYAADWFLAGCPQEWQDVPHIHGVTIP